MKKVIITAMAIASFASLGWAESSKAAARKAVTLSCSFNELHPDRPMDEPVRVFKEFDMTLKPEQEEVTEHYGSEDTEIEADMGLYWIDAGSSQGQAFVATGVLKVGEVMTFATNVQTGPVDPIGDAIIINSPMLLYLEKDARKFAIICNYPEKK